MSFEFNTAFVLPSVRDEHFLSETHKIYYPGRLEATAELRYHDHALGGLRHYSDQYVAQHEDAVEAIRTKVKETCLELPEAKAVQALRRRLQSINSSIEESQAKLQDAERRYDEAALKDEKTDAIEAEMANLSSELKRLRTLLRLVGGGSPNNPDYNATCPPALEAAVKVYQDAAEKLWDQARQQRVADLKVEHDKRLTEVEKLLSTRAVELDVLRIHRDRARHHINSTHTPEV
jgi:hypothetical protein